MDFSILDGYNPHFLAVSHPIYGMYNPIGKTTLITSMNHLKTAKRAVTSMLNCLQKKPSHLVEAKKHPRFENEVGTTTQFQCLDRVSVINDNIQ